MNSTISNIGIKTFEDKFFDLFDKDFCRAPFTDYYYLNREIIIASDEGENIRIELGENKNKKKITSIDELRSNLNGVVTAVLQIYNEMPIFQMVVLNDDIITMLSENPQNPLENSEDETIVGYVEKYGQSLFSLVATSLYFDFNDINIDLLEDQLIFDILFDKYLAESDRMTRGQYSQYMSELLRGSKFADADQIYKKVERAMKDHYNMMKYSQLREELEQLGINFAKYEEHYKAKKKPKFIWDYFYYNRSMITYRQYRRQLKRDGNYLTKDFVKDIGEYDEFVKKVLSEKAISETGEPQKYFNRSMDYYYLESYKRIDYILKLINSIPEIELMKINIGNFLVKRFPFPVLVPYEKNNELRYNIGHYKYYRPLFYVEEELRDQAQSDGKFNYSFYADSLYKYYLVRAKAYELFKYHAEYISSDYNEINEFIRHHYNIRTYHDSDKIKAMTQGWEQTMMTTRNFIIISNALFWESPVV